MANAGSGTAGSQFFIVYADSTLDPATYTIWGTVTSGLDIVQEVASVGRRRRWHGRCAACSRCSSSRQPSSRARPNG